MLVAGDQSDEGVVDETVRRAVKVRSPQRIGQASGARGERTSHWPAPSSSGPLAAKRASAFQLWTGLAGVQKACGSGRITVWLPKRSSFWRWPESMSS